MGMDVEVIDAQVIDGVDNMLAQAADMDLGYPFEAVKAAVGTLDPQTQAQVWAALHGHLLTEGYDPDMSI